MILAAMTLLSMSLNAQLLPTYKAANKSLVAAEKGANQGQSTNNGGFRAPLKVNLADNEYLLGAYNTAAFGTTGYGLYSTTSSGEVDVSTILNRSEVEEFLGDEIIGYRFATTGSVDCYRVLVSTEGPNHYIDDIYQFFLTSSEEAVSLSGTEWHEYMLDEPVTFEIADSVQSVWIGYTYIQTSGGWFSSANTPILVNPNSTSHTTYAYSYSNKRFYNVTSTLNNGDLAVQLIMRSNNKTPKPEITYVENGDNVVITATGEGTVTLTIGDQTQTGTGSASITLPRTDTTYSVTATATAKDGDKDESDPATKTITVPFLQTEKPSITYTTQGETVVITATATEPDTDAEVTLTVGNGEPVTGIGSVSVTVPCGVQSSSVTATATAQVNGKAQSETETAQITIPAGDGWTEMTGTYDPDDLLSFKVKVGNDTTDIMLIDQFMASTVHNDHPNGYTYVLKETIDNVEMASNPATVPVYKTNSNLNGFYTEAQVIADNKYDENKLTAHTLNTQIEYDVVPDNNVLYYSLYRGDKNAQRPVIDVDHRISQLQKFEDKVDGNVMYYFNENHQQGVLPKYEHIGSQTAQRLDMNYVTGTGEDELSYVPVIWTFGLYTARGDGKNNSYGSDIKHSYVGKVNISVEGLKNDGNNTTGQWDADGTTYCVYSPIITLSGVTPNDGAANDGDTYQYVPYMYRVWCTYPNAHNFTLLANPDGKVHLADAGAITAPFLIGEVTAEDTEAWNGTGEEVKIGRALESGEAQQPWSFGVPVNESSSNVQFVARFYYKKIVTPGAQVNGLRGTRDNDEAAFAIAENSDDGQGIVTGINELADIVYVVSTTYVNAQGMQSDKPFDGLNIVVTRYSDGTTRTTKVVR